MRCRRNVENMYSFAVRSASPGNLDGKTLTFTSFNGGTAVNVTFGDGTNGTVKTLDQTVDVDYFLPGCPPNPEQIAPGAEAGAQPIDEPYVGYQPSPHVGYPLNGSLFQGINESRA